MASTNKELRKQLSSIGAQHANQTSDFLGGDAHREAIERKVDELNQRIENGSIRADEASALREQIETNLSAQEIFDAHRASRSSWARLPFTGLGFGILWVALALGVSAMHLSGGFLFVALMAAALLASLIGAAFLVTPPAKLAERLRGASPRPTSLWFGFGSGGLLLMLAALMPFWSNPRFVLSIAFFVLFEALRNLLGFVMLFVGQNPLFAKQLVELDVKRYKAQMKREGKSLKADVVDLIRANKSSAVATSLHALAGAALGALLPLAVLWGMPQIARHHLATTSPAALAPVDAAQLGFANPTAARAAADALQLRAKQALAAAEATGNAASPDWIENQVLRAGLPAGVSNQWAQANSGAFMHGDELIALSAQPVFLDGAWTPAGFYIAQAHQTDYVVANAYGSGMWFVPFYRDAACKTLATDSAALDREWGAFIRPAALAQHPLPREAVGCVGEPIAVRPIAPLVWPQGAKKDMRGLATMEGPLTLALHVANLTDSPIAPAKGVRAKTDGLIESHIRRFFDGTLPYYMPSVAGQ